MIISWIIFFLVAVATGVFFVLYKDVIALILFLSVLLIPIVLLIIHLISFLLTKIDVEIEESNASTKKPIKIIISIENKSPFSITHIRVDAKFKNRFFDTEHDCRFVISSTPFSTKKLKYEISSVHIGNIDFLLKKAVFYDYFSMFRFSKRINITKVVPIYPESVPVSVEVRPNNFFLGEADKFSRVKAGDDPSEVFNIREYIQGDKLNKIHWKLTSKTDKYMVKEYSLPVSDNIFIYLDLKCKDESEESLLLIDSLIKSFFSISKEFINKGIIHYVGWYNSRRNVFVKSKIKTDADIYLTLNKIFSDTVFYDEPMLENCDFFSKHRYSHIVLMTSNSAKDVEKLFSGFDTSISLFSIVAIENERDDFPSDDETMFVPVVPECEEKCLYGIKL